MPRRKLSKAELKASRQEFVAGVRGIHRQEVKPTQWELLLKRLGLSEANCIANVEVAAWVKKNCDRLYIPELVMYRLQVQSSYDVEPSPFSLTEAGVVIPDIAPSQLQDEEIEQDEHQTQ